MHNMAYHRQPAFGRLVHIDFSLVGHALGALARLPGLLAYQEA